MTQVRKVLNPVSLASRVLRYIPAYDRLGERTTSGHALSVEGTPKVHESHVDFGVNDAVVLPKQALPVNDSASGFTVIIAARADGVGTRSLLQLCTPDFATAFPVYIEVTATGFSFGVQYDAPGTNTEAISVLAANGDHVIACRFTRGDAFGSRLAIFVDGVNVAVNSRSDIGANADGLLVVPIDSQLRLGKVDVSATAVIGGVDTFSEALSDEDVIAESLFVQHNFPAIH